MGAPEAAAGAAGGTADAGAPADTGIAEAGTASGTRGCAVRLRGANRVTMGVESSTGTGRCTSLAGSIEGASSINVCARRRVVSREGGKLSTPRPRGARCHPPRSGPARKVQRYGTNACASAPSLAAPPPPPSPHSAKATRRHATPHHHHTHRRGQHLTTPCAHTPALCFGGAKSGARRHRGPLRRAQTRHRQRYPWLSGQRLHPHAAAPSRPRPHTPVWAGKKKRVPLQVVSPAAWQTPFVPPARARWAECH